LFSNPVEDVADELHTFAVIGDRDGITIPVLEHALFRTDRCLEALMSPSAWFSPAT
jgi:hypothetical protein